MSHALLSPSSAHRWLVCTPSARLEEGFADTSSESAAEGTLAHAIAELKLSYEMIEPMPKRTYTKKFKELQSDERYTKEMDRLTDEYVEYIKGLALAYSEKPHIQAEQRLDLNEYVPDCFGTSDAVLIAGSDLHIIDFKYGRNVPVSPVDNPQLKLYALGALDAYGLFYSIETVHMHIVQPRNDEGGGVWSLSAEELRRWGDSIRPQVTLAFTGAGDAVPGEHCGFCKAKAVCRAFADKNLTLAKHEFKAPPLLTHTEVGEILTQARDLSAWAKSLEEWALSEALNGTEVPGWKAVEGRRLRVWTDQEKAFKKLILSGIEETVLYERKPLTLSKIESEIGKREFNELVGEFVVKEPGKPTLVPESDKREVFRIKTSAEEDFKNE